jgi:hypothetical protein
MRYMAANEGHHAAIRASAGMTTGPLMTPTIGPTTFNIRAVAPLDAWDKKNSKAKSFTVPEHHVVLYRKAGSEQIFTNATYVRTISAFNLINLVGGSPQAMGITASPLCGVFEGSATGADRHLIRSRATDSRFGFGNGVRDEYTFACKGSVEIVDYWGGVVRGCPLYFAYVEFKQIAKADINRLVPSIKSTGANVTNRVLAIPVASFLPTNEIKDLLSGKLKGGHAYTCQGLLEVGRAFEGSYSPIELHHDALGDTLRVGFWPSQDNKKSTIFKDATASSTKEFRVMHSEENVATNHNFDRHDTFRVYLKPRTIQ